MQSNYGVFIGGGLTNKFVRMINHWDKKIKLIMQLSSRFHVVVSSFTQLQVTYNNKTVYVVILWVYNIYYDMLWLFMILTPLPFTPTHIYYPTNFPIQIFLPISFHGYPIHFLLVALLQIFELNNIYPKELFYILQNIRNYAPFNRQQYISMCGPDLIYDNFSFFLCFLPLDVFKV